MTSPNIPRTCNTCTSICKPQKKGVKWKKECTHPTRNKMPKTEDDAFGIPIYYPTQTTKCKLYELSFQSKIDNLPPIKPKSRKTTPSKKPVEPEPTVIQTPQTTLDDFF